MDKNELRKKMLALRDAIPQTARAQKSTAICESLKGLEIFRRARHVLFYYPVRSEVSLLPLMEELLGVHGEDLLGAYGEPKTVYLPRLEGDRFRALPVSDLDLLEEGDFGIPQPPESISLSLGSTDFDGRIDLVLVPGVAFSKKGDRLGMGKGYYDKYLERVCNLPNLGIAFSEQILEALPVEPHDQRLDGVLTD